MISNIRCTVHFYNYHYSFKIDCCLQLYILIFIGVTDSKAVTGSKSTLDITPSTSSLVVIITGVSTGIVFTVLLVCLFVTCKRKVFRYNIFIVKNTLIVNYNNTIAN